MPSEPKWISRVALELLHGQSLAAFGGAQGMRDPNLLESALARPQHLFAYHPESPLSSLAAAYAIGIARNHPFVDGNKRAALLAALVFLEINGFKLNFDKVDAITTMFAVASGDLSESTFQLWIESRLTARQ